MNEHHYNTQVFLALQTAGADFDLPHRIDHVILGSADRLHELEGQLTHAGFDTKYQEPGVLIAMQWMNLDINEMNVRTLALTKLASQFSCRYDGWGTTPQRRGSPAIS